MIWRSDGLVKSPSAALSLRLLRSTYHKSMPRQSKTYSDLVLMPAPQSFQGNSPFRQDFDLEFDLAIIPLAQKSYEEIRRACTPPGKNYRDPFNLRWLYAIVRRNAPRDKWDADERLQTLIALSRLAHPTSLSFRFAAKVIESHGDKESQIVPGPINGPGAAAWVIDTTQNWLTPTHVKELKVLLNAYMSYSLPPRPRRALWYHEYAARSYYIDVRWTFVATALESLLNTNSRNATKQFVQRVQQLSMKVGEGSLSEQRANDMYDYRSRLVHGQGIGGAKSEHFDVYQQMENLLRATLRKCVSEPSFAAIFESDNNINAEFPVPQAAGNSTL